MRGYTAKHMPKVYEDDAAREAAAKAVADGAEPCLLYTSIVHER